MSKQVKEIEFEEIQLATNGTLLTKETIETLLTCYTELAISLHKSSSLSSVIQKAKNLYKQRQKIGSKTSLRMNVVLEEFSPRETEILRQKTRGFCDDFKVFPMITENMQSTPREMPFCPQQFMYLGIMWNGETVPCCHILASGAFTLGNVTDKTVKSVFKGKKYQDLRYGNILGTPCETCNVYGERKCPSQIM